MRSIPMRKAARAAGFLGPAILFSALALTGFSQSDFRSSLLREATQAAQQVSSTRNRISALSQVASLQARLGDLGGAERTSAAAFQLYQTLTTQETKFAAMHFALHADFPMALRIAERVTDEEWRNRVYQRVLERWVRAGDAPQAGEILTRIHEPLARDRALLYLLETCRGTCDAARMASLAKQLTHAEFRPVSEAIVAAEAARSGATADFSKPVEMAAALGADQPWRETVSFSTNCVSDSGTPGRDASLQRVGEVQVSAGDLVGAHATSSRILDVAIRAQLETLLVERYARAGNFERAVEILNRIATAGCKGDALEKLAAEEWRAGRRESALQRVRALGTPEARAFGLMGMAMVVPKELRARDALPLLQEAAVAAGQMSHAAERGSLLAAIARAQAEVGAAAAARTTLQGLPQAGVESGSSSVLIPGAEALAAVGEAHQALAMLHGQREEQRAVALRRIARILAERSSASDLLAFIRNLSSPFERCLAFLGAAEAFPVPAPRPR